MSVVEINFDGLVGPTHNYAGQAPGNLASDRNRDKASAPKAAALQGLAKMRRMAQLGLTQGVFAPTERPNIPWLRALGFSGTDRQVWEAAARAAPALARQAMAASSMWAANAATVSPSADCADGRVHFTPANLLTMGHRAQEAPDTTRQLRRVFADPARFMVHDPLPAHPDFADEGAANHMRFADPLGAPGLEAFVYGRAGGEPPRPGFPARQTLEACEAIARRHRLDPARVAFLRQSDEAIDAGAFHNDVVAVSHEMTLFRHEAAFVEDVATALPGVTDVPVARAAVPLDAAVRSYLFNSMLVRPPGANGLVLVAPAEIDETSGVRAAVEALIASGAPIGAVEVVDVRESMRNGGGPACLRLRVALTADERAAMTQGFLWTAALGDALEAWVEAHYRDRLSSADLLDPAIVDEMQAALDALTGILPLGRDFYSFQR